MQPRNIAAFGAALALQPRETGTEAVSEHLRSVSIQKVRMLSMVMAEDWTRKRFPVFKTYHSFL
jgi:hypothetical protein